MRFNYYRDLSARNRATYDKSDRLPEVGLSVGPELEAAVAAVRTALAEENLAAVRRAMTRLSRLACSALEVAPLAVTVKAKRPIRSDGEYYGLYERERGGAATLTLWMRTARQKKVVTFKTFLRTFVHELCHHLDFDRYRLRESFHTQGFFKRESSLYRSLVPAEEPAVRSREKAAAGAKRQPKRAAKAKPEKPPRLRSRTKRKPESGQTELPFDDGG